LAVIKKISRRILTSVLTGTIVIFSIYGIVNYVYTKNKIIDLTEKIVEKTFRSTYNQLEAQINPVFTHARSTNFVIHSFQIDKPEIKRELTETLKNFPYMYGAGIFYHDKKDSTLFYIYKKNNPDSTFETSTKPVHTYDDTIQSKYNISISNDTLTFIYYFLNNAKKEGNLRYDFPLNLFTNTLNMETRHLNSKHFLFNRKDNKIYLINSLSNDSSISIKQDVKKIEHFISKDKFGFYTSPDFLKNRALFISKLRGTNLILASTMQTDTVIKQFRTFFNIASLMVILTVVLLAYHLNRIIIRATKPIVELSALSRKIEKGSLHINIPDTFYDSETLQLSKTLRIVQGRMQRYVSNLNSTLKEKRAFEQELNIAEKIQLDMLPKADRALTDQPEIDVYSIIQPAKGVAGDFYDYFFIDDEKQNLFFVLGDVSGKGIPAALFMVKTITLLQIEARKGKSPAEIFEYVNNQLIYRNEEGMFVTAICGIINIKSGKSILCDAGHNIPLSALKSKDFSYFPLEKNMPLGILENNTYKETTCILSPEDSIVLYSDGLPEANSKSGKMLEYNAIENELKDCGKKDIQVIANTIMDLYDRFTINAIPNDDVTIFIIKFFGKLKH
jgi:sigma-B regulation protein RsbU (phosphoserine phosphatase)